jgi:hypothetical protein
MRNGINALEKLKRWAAVDAFTKVHVISLDTL